MGIEDFKASNYYISVVSNWDVYGNVDLLTVKEWKKEQFLKIFEDYKSRNIFNPYKTGLFFRLPPNKINSSKGDSYNGWKNKERIMVLLPCSTEGTDKHHCILGRMKNLAALNMSVSCP